MEFVSISGIRSIGNLANENTPKTMIAAKHRLVIIGRLTAPSYNVIELSFSVCCVFLLFHHFYLLSVVQTALSCNHNLIAGLYSGEYFVVLSKVLAEFNFVV